MNRWQLATLLLLATTVVFIILYATKKPKKHSTPCPPCPAGQGCEQGQICADPDSVCKSPNLCQNPMDYTPKCQKLPGTDNWWPQIGGDFSNPMWKGGQWCAATSRGNCAWENSQAKCEQNLQRLAYENPGPQ